jgi:hypothetical protein
MNCLVTCSKWYNSRTARSLLSLLLLLLLLERETLLG